MDLADTFIKRNLDPVLNEKFTSTFRKGYAKFGNITMPLRFAEMREEIANFEVFDDDVWVCSFPKTGTTWTQEMVWLLCNDFNYKLAEENLGARFPFLEVSAVFDFRDLMRNNQEFKPPVFLEDSLKFVKEQARPRFIKTHLPWVLLPRQITQFQKRPKIIYVTRNPKDTCISYFHHARLFEGFKGNFGEFVQLFINGNISFGPFWENVLGFFNLRHEPNIVFLQYETMKRNLTSVVLELAKFFAISVSVDQLETLLDHLSFESMKTNNAVNFEPVLEFHRRFNLVQVDGTFMRSGKDQGHKTEMTGEQVMVFDKWIAKNLKNSEIIY